MLLGIAAMFFMRARQLAPAARAMQWPDAAGLGLFTAGGTQMALSQGRPAIVAVLTGVITAVFGGVLRDVVCNEIPSAFRDYRPYAICSFAGGWVVVAAQALRAPAWTGLLVAAVVTAGLRALALATGFRLPKWQRAGSPHG